MDRERKIAVTGNVMLRNIADATREAVVGEQGQIPFDILTTEEHKKCGMVKCGKTVNPHRLYMTVQDQDTNTWYNAEEISECGTITNTDMTLIGFGITWVQGTSMIDVTYNLDTGTYKCKLVLLHSAGEAGAVLFTVTCKARA